MKVYAVNSGIYSDYRIHAMFSTKEKATEFMFFFHDSDYNEIEEYTLDPPYVDLKKRGYSIWFILMLRDGTVEKVIRREGDGYETDMPLIWERTKVPAYRGKGVPDCLRDEVWAKSEKHAIKIVNEHRTRMIANNEWKQPKRSSRAR